VTPKPITANFASDKGSATFVTFGFYNRNQVLFHALPTSRARVT